MKKILVITVTTAAAIAAYFAIRHCSCNNQDNDQLSEVKRERHLTNAFSKAKQQAVSEE